MNMLRQYTTIYKILDILGENRDYRKLSKANIHLYNHP